MGKKKKGREGGRKTALSKEGESWRWNGNENVHCPREREREREPVCLWRYWKLDQPEQWTIRNWGFNVSTRFRLDFWKPVHCIELINNVSIHSSHPFNRRIIIIIIIIIVIIHREGIIITRFEFLDPELHADYPESRLPSVNIWNQTDGLEGGGKRNGAG